MSNGANGVHLQLREALENYIKSQYFGKSPILLSAAQNKLNQEGVLYQNRMLNHHLLTKVRQTESSHLPSYLIG